MKRYAVRVRFFRGQKHGASELVDEVGHPHLLLCPAACDVGAAQADGIEAHFARFGPEAVALGCRRSAEGRGGERAQQRQRPCEAQQRR